MYSKTLCVALCQCSHSAADEEDKIRRRASRQVRGSRRSRRRAQLQLDDEGNGRAEWKEERAGRENKGLLDEWVLVVVTIVPNYV